MMTLSTTVAIYRHGDSQRYAALGSTSNHRLTRGQRIKCSTKFACQKEDVPSVLRDTWQCTHGMARIRTQQPRLHL